MKRLLAILALLPALAFAWEPARPVTVYVGNTPGAGNEIAFRKLARFKRVFLAGCRPRHWY